MKASKLWTVTPALSFCRNIFDNDLQSFAEQPLSADIRSDQYWFLLMVNSASASKKAAWSTSLFVRLYRLSNWRHSRRNTRQSELNLVGTCHSWALLLVLRRYKLTPQTGAILRVYLAYLSSRPSADIFTLWLANNKIMAAFRLSRKTAVKEVCG